MGSGSRSKVKAQSDKVFPSGNMGMGAAGGAGAAIQESEDTESLKIRLKRLNPDVLAQVSVGENVNIDAGQSPFVAVTRFGKLGEVPQRYESAIKAKGLYSGSITIKQDDPPSVQVTLSR